MNVLLENLEILILVTLFVAGYLAGRWNESRHYRSIRRREAELSDVLIFTNRFPPNAVERRDTHLVSGSVVISDDYFKTAVAGLYNLVGGRVRSYESLLDRARREAVLRMKQSARERGEGMIINVKFQTFAIGGRQGKGVTGVEMLAYGTLLVRNSAPGLQGSLA